MITLECETDNVVIIVPKEHLQSLRVALQPCACRNTKSNRTAKTRSFFVKLLGLAVFLKPGDVRHVEAEELGQG